MDPIANLSLDRSSLSRAFRKPIVPATGAVQEAPSVAFGDLVRMMAEGIADAQLELDRASAEMIVDLASTRVDVVRSITETINEDGSVTIIADDAENLSLLELGVQPTFYQFRESTIEVAMDLSIAEEIETESSGAGRKTLFAKTRDITSERKLNRDVSVSSKLTATLVPVPSPLRLDVTRSTVTADDSSGDGDV